jgi:predicted MPP superfamily phosphohydrolase
MVVSTRRGLLKLGVGSALGGLGLFTFLANEVERLTVTRMDVGLPSKAVFLTDLHIHLGTSYLDRLADTISEEEPDIILLAGDTVDEYTGDRSAVEGFIKSLNAVEKFAVMGNHEYWSEQAAWVNRLLKENGFTVLYNNSVGSSAGKITGLDWDEGRQYPALHTDGLVIVHDPNAALHISGNCLILAGHTHGGIVLGQTTLYSNSYFVRGLYELGPGTTLYVSRGLGQIIPLRINSSPELVILT